MGKERSDVRETGEIKRVVSSLLMRIDSLPSYTIEITASIHPELLDRVVWRRFQLRISLPSPSTQDLVRFFSKQLFKLDNSPDISPVALAKRIGSAIYAEAEEFIMDLLRRWVLSLNEMSLKTILNEQLKSWDSRTCPVMSCSNIEEKNDAREAAA